MPDWTFSSELRDLPLAAWLRVLGRPSRWAVILCKFADDVSATVPRTHYERLFTGAGTGSLNMTDFFADVSHGQLDLTGSQVFGWYTLDLATADYAGNVATPPPGKVNRDGLVATCRQKALDAGVPLSTFDGLVVSMNGAVDLFGYVGGATAFCDSHSLQPSLLGQEMGHGYGLDHARIDGSTADYQDPYDVMSTANAYLADNAEWTNVGPALNASTMRAFGWLDENRVWSGAASGFDAEVELRPLHRRDLPGHLAAEVGPYLVELRVRERWDAGLPGPVVLVHHFSDNHSYLTAALTEGGSYSEGLPGFRFARTATVHVDSLDEAGRRARIRVQYRPAERFPWWEQAGQLIGGVEVDGGGYLIINGKIVKVPPRGPVFELAQQVLALQEADGVADVNLRTQVRARVLRDVLTGAATALAAQDPVRSPARHRRVAQGPKGVEVNETVVMRTPVPAEG